MMSIATYTAEQLEHARTLGTATLYEASGLPSSSLDPAIHTIWPGASVAGPAWPVECSPGDNLAIHLALEKTPRGSILVVAAGGYVAGYWGEVLTVAAEAAGVAGLVIDGGVRDVAALIAHRFPVFARGISMRGTIKASAPSIGQPILFAGTPVAPGDLVVADDDGVVVIPGDAAELTLAKGQTRCEKEARIMDGLRSGQSSLELLGLARWREHH
jgi:4-hydroxy-4-methyl-2-oxoglutarate aldolase